MPLLGHALRLGLGIAIGVLAVARCAPAQTSGYSLTLEPPQATPGQPIKAVLRYRAARAGTVLDFDHASLVLRVSRRGDTQEPWLTFPNVSARQEGDLLIRLQSGSPPRAVKAGEEFQRVFDLLALFPQLADAGDFGVSFDLQAASPPVRLPPVTLRITPREP